MAIFFLTYDLSHEDGIKHYVRLREELTRLRAHRVLTNACLINLNTVDPRRLIDALKPLVEERDRLFAVRIEPQNYWYVNTMRGTNDWIEANPPVTMEDDMQKRTTQ